MRSLDSVVVNALASNAGNCGIEFSHGGWFFAMSSRTLGPPCSNGYMALSEGEVIGDLDVVLATLSHLHTAK